MKIILKNEDLFLENIRVYKNIDLGHTNELNTVGIESKIVNEKREYTIYLNDEFGSVKIIEATEDFDYAIKKARANYEILKSNYHDVKNENDKNKLLTDRDMLKKIGKKNAILRKYNIDSENIEILDNYIIVKTIINSRRLYRRVIIIVDKEWNIINIDKETFSESTKKITDKFYCKYCNEKAFLYSFSGFTLKDIIDINSLWQNIDLDLRYFLDISESSNVNTKAFISLLAYIKFIGYKIEEYFNLSYSLCAKNLVTPDINEYINSFLEVISKTIDDCISENTIPTSKIILDNLGELNTENSYLLNFVINLVLRTKGYEIKNVNMLKDGRYSLEKIETEKIPNMSEICTITKRIFNLYKEMGKNDIQSFLDICWSVLDNKENLTLTKRK